MEVEVLVDRQVNSFPCSIDDRLNSLVLVLTLGGANQQELSEFTIMTSDLLEYFPLLGNYFVVLCVFYFGCLSDSFTIILYLLPNERKVTLIGFLLSNLGVEGRGTQGDSVL